MTVKAKIQEKLGGMYFWRRQNDGTKQVKTNINWQIKVEKINIGEGKQSFLTIRLYRIKI